VKLNQKELIDLVLSSFEAEQNSDLKRGLALLHPEYAVTEMNVDFGGNTFHRTEGTKIKELAKKVFDVSGKRFQFVNVIADESKQTVMVEFIESNQDSNNKKYHRVPFVSVCEIKDGKIYRTRLYNDPGLYKESISQDMLDKALS